MNEIQLAYFLWHQRRRNMCVDKSNVLNRENLSKKLQIDRVPEWLYNLDEKGERMNASV